MYDQVFIENKQTKVGINPQGGYVTSWKINDTDILYQGSSIRRTGIPILFPYYGKAHQTRMHGFGRDCQWEISTHDQASVTMELTPDNLTEEDRRDYPFEFSAQITVNLLSDSELLYTLEVTNNDSKDLPISPGIHPYWSIPHQEKPAISINGINGFSAASVDWNNTPPDDPYDFSGQATVSLGNKTLGIEELSLPRVVKFLQLWSQTPVRDPDFNFLCVEPICGLNYGIEESPLLVKQGETWQMKVRFSITSV